MQGKVAEGVFTTQAALQLARRCHVEMPITEQIFSVLNEGKPPQEAIYELMTRSSKSEYAAQN
jgi:glycerol-3-phosphate dehydrogenase (NAD(P)+)